MVCPSVVCTKDNLRVTNVQHLQGIYLRSIIEDH
nr:MAG TPA: hypothetical protein [Caudoviricetes sp.]